MKARILVFILVSAMLIALLPLASAAKDSATLAVTEEHDSLAAGGEIKLHAVLNDINSTSGIVCIEFAFVYDAELLELSSYEVKMPDEWSKDLDTSMAEDFTVASPGKFTWSVLNSELGTGIRDDGVFTADLVFKIKDGASGSTDIIVNRVSIANDNMEEVDCNSVKLGFTLENEGTADITGSESEFSVDISVPSAAENSSPESVGESAAASGASSEEEKGISATTVIIIVGAIVVLAAAAAVIILLRKRKGVKS